MLELNNISWLSVHETVQEKKQNNFKSCQMQFLLLHRSKVAPN